MRRIPTVKVGILTVVSISLLVFVLIWLRGRGLTNGEMYNVRFNDVDGMREGAAVQLMGIRVGFIDKIIAEETNGKFYVNVAFSINDANIDIPKGSTLSIEQSGIIGEKFLEVTPPVLQTVTLTMFKAPESAINKGLPVKFLYEEGYMDVGTVEKVERFQEDELIQYKLSFRITRPGSVMPADPLYELVQDDHKQYYLRVLPQQPVVAHAPDPNLKFTIENPLRIKRFLEIQLESAEALKVTNDKVNQLLSDETIATLNSTLKNTEVMTARATDVLNSANHLFQTTSRDLEQLVKASDLLAKNVTLVSANINDVIGNPQLKQDIVQTVASIQQSSKALSEIMQDPSLKETLTLTKDTSKSAAELVNSLKKTAEDKELQNRLNTSLSLMNDSLAKLSVVLGNVENLTNDDQKTLKTILQDTRDTTDNLKTFSKKLNGRFLLFRLMF